MVKNQHLLLGLVGLGVINLLTIFVLLARESGSAPRLSQLTRELAAAREEQRQATGDLARETDELRRQLNAANHALAQLDDETTKLASKLTKVAKALETAEERLNKLAPPE